MREIVGVQGNGRRFWPETIRGRFWSFRPRRRPLGLPDPLSLPQFLVSPGACRLLGKMQPPSASL